MKSNTVTITITKAAIFSTKIAAILLALLLTFQIFNVLGAITPTPASNSVNIQTSADNTGDIFFGQGSVQIVITDPNAKSGGGANQATIPVAIVAESRQGKKVAADTFDIPETVLGSGKFEFYLSHSNSFLANGAGIHPLNTFGIAHIANKSQAFQLATPAVGKVAPVITFGNGGELDTGSKLFENVLFKILYGEKQVLLSYDETPAQLMLDRDTYSSNSIIHVYITDQDANLNPTVPDRFIVNKDQVKALFSLLGGTFNVKDNITFIETGANTAIFAAPFLLNDTIFVTAKTLVLTLHDKADYQDVNSSENNDHTDISKDSFNIQDTDGKMSVPDFITFASGLKLSLADFDQNKDSESIDTIRGHVTIAIEGNGDSETADLKETQDNSGVFTINNSDNELKTSFTSGNAKNNDGVLEFTSHNIHNNIKVTYTDPLNHNSQPEAFTALVKLRNTLGKVALSPPSVGINGQIILSINDPDLNNNPHSKDSYTFTPVDNKPVPLAIGNTQLGDFAQIQIQIEGNNTFSFKGNETFTLVETDINSSIFEAKIDIRDLAADLGYPLKVGDKVKITYFDNMETLQHPVSATIDIV